MVEYFGQLNTETKEDKLFNGRTITYSRAKIQYENSILFLEKVNDEWYKVGELMFHVGWFDYIKETENFLFYRIASKAFVIELKEGSFYDYFAKLKTPFTFFIEEKLENIM